MRLNHDCSGQAGQRRASPRGASGWVCFLALVAVGPIAQADPLYGVYAHVKTYVSEFPLFGDTKELSNHGATDQPFAYLSVYSEGPRGSSGGADAIASLADGWLKSYASALVPETVEDPLHSSSNVASNSDVRFDESLFFTLEPGRYDHDVVVSLHGQVSGFLTNSPTSQAIGNSSFYAILDSSAGTPASLVDLRWSGNGAVLEGFTLSVTLFRAGEVVLGWNDHVSSTLSARLITGSEVWSQFPDRPASATSVAEFSNSVRFLRLDVPPAVASWSSASGVFMSQIVPEPFSASLVLCAVTPVALLLARRARAAHPRSN